MGYVSFLYDAYHVIGILGNYYIRKLTYLHDIIYPLTAT